MSRRWSSLLACGFVVGAIVQVRINYHDQDFTLSGFDHFSATLQDKGIAFNGDGNPLSIQIQSSGTTITGKTADGNAVRGSNGAYFLQSANVAGNADLAIDTAVAQKFAEQQASAAGKTVAKPAESTNTHIKSETLKYSGVQDSGRVDFPAAVTIDSSSTGHSVGKDNKATDFARTLHLTGSKGFLTMSLGATGNNALQTGEISGPVTYSGKTDTKSADNVTQTSTFDGKADNLRFDFTKEPRTLTMTGNVTISAKGSAATGDIVADTVIVTLDANLKPTKIDITGSPAKTTMHQEPPK